MNEKCHNSAFIEDENETNTTDNESGMQLGNSFSIDPKAAIRSTPNSIFDEIAINHETTNMMTRSNIPSDVIFRRKLFRKHSRACPDISKISVVTKGKSRVFAGEYKNIFLGFLRTVNRFCNFVVKRQRLKAIESRKTMGPFWCGYFQCKRKECPVKVKLILHSQFSDNIHMEFQGNVYHDVRKIYADDIRGIDREELKDDFKKNLFTPSTQVYVERLNNVSDEVFASGNRENAGKSPKVIQQVKSEVTYLCRKKEQ